MTDTITVTGVVGSDPRLHVTTQGLAIASFRLASTRRYFDRAKGTWEDGETNWYTVSGFRQLASNTIASVRKGDRVVVQGRLRVRSWPPPRLLRPCWRRYPSRLRSRPHPQKLRPKKRPVTNFRRAAPTRSRPKASCSPTRAPSCAPATPQPRKPRSIGCKLSFRRACSRKSARSWPSRSRTHAATSKPPSAAPRRS